MEELRGIAYLRNKLAMHISRIEARYNQYDMKKEEQSVSIVIPTYMRKLYIATLGWCTKAVDSLADRLSVKEFKDEENLFEVNKIFEMNNPDIFFDSAILNALIASCSFVYISTDETGYPRLQVIEANNATGVIDPITGLLKEGYAVLQRNDEGTPIVEAYFTPEYTSILYNGEEYEVFRHEVGYPLLVPIIHRPDAVRPFGRSRITRSAEYYQKYAKNTFERAEITAEFYSFPQKYILGTSSNDDFNIDTWKATISTLLVLSKDEEGDKPSVGQFTTSSMSPFTEQLRTAAAGFAGETGLTLDDLGFVSDNPSSSEAIKASHETLRTMAKKAQRCFTSGFRNVAFLAVCLRDKIGYRRDKFMKIKIKWEPVFETDLSSLGVIGDASVKLNQAVDGFIDKEVIEELTGIRGANNGS